MKTNKPFESKYAIKLPPLLVSKQEAQVLLGIKSRRTFDRRIEEGVLDPVPVGRGRPMFRLDQIKRLAGVK